MIIASELSAKDHIALKNNLHELPHTKAAVKARSPMDAVPAVKARYPDILYGVSSSVAGNELNETALLTEHNVCSVWLAMARQSVNALPRPD